MSENGAFIQSANGAFIQSQNGARGSGEEAPPPLDGWAFVEIWDSDFQPGDTYDEQYTYYRASFSGDVRSTYNLRRAYVQIRADLEIPTPYTVYRAWLDYQIAPVDIEGEIAALEAQGFTFTKYSRWSQVPGHVAQSPLYPQLLSGTDRGLSFRCNSIYEVSIGTPIPRTFNVDWGLEGTLSQDRTNVTIGRAIRVDGLNPGSDERSTIWTYTDTGEEPEGYNVYRGHLIMRDDITRLTWGPPTNPTIEVVGGGVISTSGKLEHSGGVFANAKVSVMGKFVQNTAGEDPTETIRETWEVPQDNSDPNLYREFHPGYYVGAGFVYKPDADTEFDELGQWNIY